MHFEKDISSIYKRNILCITTIFSCGIWLLLETQFFKKLGMSDGHRKSWSYIILACIEHWCGVHEKSPWLVGLKKKKKLRQWDLSLQSIGVTSERKQSCWTARVGAAELLWSLGRIRPECRLVFHIWPKRGRLQGDPGHAGGTVSLGSQ